MLESSVRKPLARMESSDGAPKQAAVSRWDRPGGFVRRGCLHVILLILLPTFPQGIGGAFSI